MPKIIQNLMKKIQKLNPTNSKSQQPSTINHQHYETTINYHHQRI
jgi:hypothetical protein